jgi:anti-sigma-K factor RskA
MAPNGATDEDHELVVLAALGALPPDEAEQAERLLASDPGRRAELGRHLEVLASIAPHAAPPPSLPARIARARGSAPAAAAPPVVSLDERRRGRGRVAALVLAAAAVVALFAVGLQLVRTDGADDLEQLAAAALDDPDAEVTAMRTVDGDELVGEVAVLPDGQGYLVADGLPALGADEAYQLWMLPDGESAPVSAGLVADGVAAFRLPPGAAGVAISLEPASGSVAPTAVVAAAAFA